MIKTGVIGLGIMGGSLVKAIQSKGGAEWVVAYNRNAEVTYQALREGMIQQAALEIDDSFQECEIIFICLPVDKIPDVAAKLSHIVSERCILTDVGSTKSDIMKAVGALSLPCTFIGGHPMTGSESSGYMASRHTLFENAYYILTPFRQTKTADVDKLYQFVENLGALPVILESEVHDYVVAAISHAPHVLASALVNTIRELDDEERLMHTLAAGGFRDITRIASSSPEIWESICRANKENIIHILTAFEKNIESFKRELIQEKSQGIHDFFSEARAYRDSFSEKRVGALYKTYDIVVEVEDQPGVIAAVAGELGRHGISIKNIGINNSRELEGGVLEICFYDRDNQKASADILRSMGYPVSIR